MSKTSPTPDGEKEHLFPLRQSAVTGAMLWLAGGIAAFGIAVVGFVVAIMSRVDQIAMHLMTTLPMLVGVGAVFSAWMTARTPRAVGVGPGGLRILGRDQPRRYEWEQVGWSTIQPGVLNQRRHLKIYDADGRVIAKLSDAIEDFDTLAELIAERIAAKGDETASRIQKAKARRTAFFMATVGVALLGVAGAVAWNTHADLRADRLLQESAVPGEAEIEDRFLAPNGITCRLVYRVTTPDGRSATRNAEVEPAFWGQLDGAKTVAVVYVPEEPSISRLLIGEAEERDAFKQPWIGYGLPAVVALMSIFFIAVAVIMWCGWDIDIDSKTGRISMKRFGTGR